MAGPSSDERDPWDFGLWDRFVQWASELGRSWEEVLRAASVADPASARASRARMRKGGAPEVRRALFKALEAIEKKRAAPTRIGRLIMGVEDWASLGRQLAALDPDKFLELLDSLRVLVDAAKRSEAASAKFTTRK